MADNFGEAFAKAVEHKAEGSKDLSQYTLADLFQPTTTDLTYNPPRGDLGQAIKEFNDKREEDN